MLSTSELYSPPALPARRVSARHPVPCSSGLRRQISSFANCCGYYSARCFHGKYCFLDPQKPTQPFSARSPDCCLVTSSVQIGMPRRTEHIFIFNPIPNPPRRVEVRCSMCWWKGMGRVAAVTLALCRCVRTRTQLKRRSCELCAVGCPWAFSCSATRAARVQCVWAERKGAPIQYTLMAVCPGHHWKALGAVLPAASGVPDNPRQYTALWQRKGDNSFVRGEGSERNERTAHCTARSFFVCVLCTFGRFPGWQGHGGLRG